MVTQSAINTRKPIEVAQGGIGVATLTTAFAPVCAGTSATGPVQVASSGMSNSGYVLTSTGSASLPTWQANAAGAGAMVLIETQTVSGVTEFSFLSGIDATYNNYVLTFSGLNSPTNPTLTAWAIQISDDGGATYKTTGYGSAGAGTSMSIAQVSAGPSTSSTVGSVNLYNFTSGVGVAQSFATYASTSGLSFSATEINSRGGQYITAPIVVNAFRIRRGSAAFTAFSGTFSLYGVLS